MKGSRVVVTGMGAVTPLGLDVASSWQGICEGLSGAALIDQFDAEAFSTRFSASVKGFSVDGYLEARDARRMDPFIQYGMVAGIQAFTDSGLEITERNAHRGARSRHARESSAHVLVRCVVPRAFVGFL